MSHIAYIQGKKMNYEKLNKNALKCIYVGLGIWDIIISAIVLIIWRNFFPENHIVKIVVMIVCALCIFELLINPMICYNRYRYAINEECIDRLFRLGKVIVTTAGGDVTIRYLDLEKAEHIAESLKERINQMVIQNRRELNEK